jgi:hypothetical protein
MINIENYCLTQDGVISKLTTYWDELKEATLQIDKLSSYLLQRAFNLLSINMLSMLIIFWLRLPFSQTVLILSFISFGGLWGVLVLISQYLRFKRLRKKTDILYNELYDVFKYTYQDAPIHEVSTEERLILQNYQVVMHFLIPPAIFFFILGMIVALNIFFFCFYYFSA